MTAIAASAEPGARTLRKVAVADSNSCDAFPERAASFTEAQQRVFEYVITGLPNKLIAYQIGVAEATVKAHVSAVLHKLQLRSRAQAIALSSAFERNRMVGSRGAN
jgi:DNA-binding NarL/FixJ family response regulator